MVKVSVLPPIGWLLKGGPTDYGTPDGASASTISWNKWFAGGQAVVEVLDSQGTGGTGGAGGAGGGAAGGILTIVVQHNI